MTYAVECAKEIKKMKSLIYHPPVPKKLSVVRHTYRGRSGRVHTYSKEEISKYVERRRL